MKYLIVCLILFSTIARAQVRYPTGFPTQKNLGWNEWGYAMSDSGLIVANRDTNWLAKYSGTIVFKPSNKKFYWFDSTNLTWNPFASTIDTTSLSNRINLKLNISDTANLWWGIGKRWVDTMYRVNDSTIGYTINGLPYTFQILGRSSGGGGGSGTVTSVGLSMPSAFTVTGSPITSSGAFNISGAGTSDQYIRGNGTLATTDTGMIPNFWVKTRSLFSATSPLTYNSVTGAFGIPNANTSGQKGAATFKNSDFSDNGSGLISLSALVTSGSCTSCSITFGADGRATAYSSGVGPTGQSVDTIYRLPGVDSIYFTINNTLYAIKDSVGSGGGAFSITNDGTGFRWVATPDGHIKTVLPSNTINWDSVSYPNALVANADTISYLATKYDVSIKQGVMRLDLGRLQQIKTYMPANGTNASATYSASYPVSSIDTAYYAFTTSGIGTENGGWLAAGTSGDSAQVTAPFGVLFGNSIMEGHPGRHGRLHPLVGGVPQNTFIPNYPDSVGQLSYHLRFLTNMRWYNHGIGGQTTVGMRKTFMRDVVGDSVPFMGDGRSNQTLKQRPQIVIIEGGINDIFNGVDPDVTKANLEWMAAKCQAANIRCVMLNIPGDATATQTQLRLIARMNEWFKSGVMDQYDACVVDFNGWWNDPAYGGDNIHSTSLIVDDVHPSLVGYDSLANFIFREAKLPVLTKAIFVNKLDPAGFTGYSRPQNITINGGAFTLNGLVDSVNISSFIPDSVWIKVISSVNVTGTTYTGFSHILWKLDNNVADSLLYTRRTYYNNSVSFPSLSGFDIIADKPSTLSARIRNNALDEVLRVNTTGAGGTFIFNGLSNTTALNSAIVSIYTSGTALGTNGNIISTGTGSRIGSLEIKDNSIPSVTGYGISTSNTSSSIAFYGTPSQNKDMFRFSAYSGTNSTMGSTGQMSMVNIIGLGFQTPGAPNSIGNTLNIQPSINITGLNKAGTVIRGIRYAPSIVSDSSTRHMGLFFLTGNNYLNVLKDSTCIGCDSTAFILAKFRVNGKVRIDSMTLPPSTYNVLVHGLTDSIIYQVPVSSFGGATIYTGDGSLAGNRVISGGANKLSLTGTQGSLYEFNVDNTGNGGAASFTTTGTGTAMIGSNTSSGAGVTGTSSSGFGGNFTSTSGVGLRTKSTPSSTNTVVTSFKGIRGTSATAAVGMGNAWDMQLTDDAGNDITTTRFSTVFTDATTASPDADFNILTITNGSLTNKFSIKNTGQLQWNNYTTSNFLAIDTTSYKPIVVDASGNIYRMSGWAATGGSSTTIYSGDGTVSGNRDVNVNNNNITFSDANLFKISADFFYQAKADGSRSYGAAIDPSSTGRQSWQFGYLPFLRGVGLYVDTLNNVGLGDATQTTMPLYNTGNSAFVRNGFQSQQGNFYAVTNITTNTTLSLVANFVTVDATSGSVTITLPAASSAFGANMGLDMVFKRLDNSGNSVTIQRAGSDTIDGANNFTLTTQYEAKRIRAISTSTWGLY